MRFPWQRTRSGRELFRAYELAILDAIGGALNREGARLLALQVAATRRVSRYIEDSCVDLVPVRRGQGPVVHDEANAFANRSLDLKLATVQVRGSRGKGKVVASCVNGQFFELYFAPSPKCLGARAEIQVGRVTLHADPMEPAPGTAGHPQLSQLNVPLRAELDAIWDSRPRWASGRRGAGRGVFSLRGCCRVPRARPAPRHHVSRRAARPGRFRRASLRDGRGPDRPLCDAPGSDHFESHSPTLTEPER